MLKSEKDLDYEKKLNFFKSLKNDKFKNSVLNNNLNDLELEAAKLRDRIETKKSYPNVYPLNSKEFNSSDINKIVKFQHESKKKEVINFDITSGIDKSIIVEIVLKDRISKKDISFTTLYY